MSLQSLVMTLANLDNVASESEKAMALWKALSPYVNSPAVKGTVNAFTDPAVFAPDGAVDRDYLASLFAREVRSDVAVDEEPCLALTCPHCSLTFLLSRG